MLELPLLRLSLRRVRRLESRPSSFGTFTILAPAILLQAGGARAVSAHRSAHSMRSTTCFEHVHEPGIADAKAHAHMRSSMSMA